MAKKTSTSKSKKTQKSKKVGLKKKSTIKSQSKKSKVIAKATQKKAAKPVAKIGAKKTQKKTAKTTLKKTAKVSPKNSPKIAVKKTVKVNKSTSAKQKQSTHDLTMIVTPLDDRLFVELKQLERKTAGGLYIPDTVSDVSGNIQGFVVSVGRGHVSKKGHLRPMDVRVGDQVVFSEHAGQKIEISNQEYIILREADVLGVITP